jgi:small-conductance mechanosensitive channel
MELLNELASLPIFRNSLLDWLLALALAAGLLLALFLARRLIRSFHARLKETPETELVELPLEILSRTAVPFFLAVSFFAGLGTLSMSEGTAQVLRSALTIALFWQAGVWVSAAATVFIERKRRRTLTTDRAIAGSLGIIGFIVRVVIWAVVVLLILENLGVDVTALVAGLGIGGIAVALAMQNILGDLFASLSITFDRPFVEGDFLIVGEYMGSVEHIGLKSTRLRSLSGEQIILANADLLGSRVRNYGRMFERRVLFTLNVTYETDPELLERIPAIIREIVAEQKDTRFDRSHFAKHGAASLDFETVYYVLSPDYNRYMDIQQAINLRIHRQFADLGIEFAYPTQRILFTALDGELSASGSASRARQSA